MAHTNAFAHEIAIDALICACQQRWEDQALASTEAGATEDVSTISS